ncbi:hypothetical protein DSM106972_018850 [Dulcicalothrix desertica PCC 7102]|uniref:Uncharacterized protein n=1 Tax=Dulcicalothrix desertica PCC 7102 TaxID=232991 RepID=A0A3S1ARV7_9CYAN|nr:CxC ATPase DNA modification system associated small protein [Dulcicalothrix desertica]RUT07625.1 hypothetical protein DSM106972_018850 [Dulcicalothrix desertica PCC 7102]TWH39794.1 hypothetical protein CAL7102_09055 [Dulcicalothrix desertica PCC 7102]
MSLDPEIIQAIKDAVAEENQPETVANRLIAWLKGMCNSSLSLDEHSVFIDTVRQAIIVNDSKDEL